MALHSMSRLGVITYLFENRHSIAYAAGILSEKPIPICRSDYYPTKTIVIVENQDEASIPVRFVQAQEIILFFHNEFLVLKSSISLVTFHHQLILKDQYLPPPLSGIFHPPSFA